jgi:hypothetical protein
MPAYVYIYTTAYNINIVVVLLVYSVQRQPCGRFSSGQTPFALLRLDCLHTQAEALDPSPPLALLDGILLSDFSSNLHLPTRPVNDVHELPSFRPIQDCESSSCYLSIAAEAFANTNSTHLMVMVERGLEACCVVRSSR